MTPEFPPGFLWGAATSAHQTEGRNVHSEWWALEQTDHPLIDVPSGEAANSYEHWPSDMDLLAAAGFTDYRFSIEWARIQPAPGVVDQRQVVHYRAMVEGARRRGLRPLVTLHHFTTPRWFADSGGWLRTDAAARFVEYLAAIAPVIATDVDHVCTINEPNMVATIPRLLAGAGSDRPGLPEPDPDLAAALIDVHHHAGRHLRREHPHLKVGWTVACHSTEAEPGAEPARRAYARSRETTFVSAARDDDWIGVQAYTRTIVGGTADDPQPRPVRDGTPTTLKGWEDYPAAAGIAVRQVAQECGDVPIIVTENGIATDDDERRIAYTRQALSGLAEAMSDGADLRGYFHWSLLDNYEWGSFTPTFGLVAVDPVTFERRPKPSLRWLGAQSPARSANLPTNY